MSKARREGQYAFFEGLYLPRNPYEVGTSDYWEWHEGWIEADPPPSPVSPPSPASISTDQKWARKWGDVAATESLARYLGMHALDHSDVREVKFNMGVPGDDASGVVLVMEDGSMVALILKSSYSAGPDGKGLPE